MTAPALNYAPEHLAFNDNRSDSTLAGQPVDLANTYIEAQVPITKYPDITPTYQPGFEGMGAGSVFIRLSDLIAYIQAEVTG